MVIHLSGTSTEVQVKLQLILQIEIQVTTGTHLLSKLCSTCWSASGFKNLDDAWKPRPGTAKMEKDKLGENGWDAEQENTTNQPSLMAQESSFLLNGVLY